MHTFTKQELRIYRWALAFFFFISGIRFASLGTVLFALPVGSIGGLPISGYLVAKFGSRKMLLLSVILFPLSMVGIGLANNGIVLALQLVFFGISGNLMNICVNTQAVSLEALYKRSIMASFHGLWSLGGFSGALLGTLMVGLKISPVYHFLYMSITCLVLAFVVYPYTLKKEEPVAQRTSIFIKPDTYLLYIGFIAFGSMVCEGTMFDWSGVYFLKVVKASAALRSFGYISFMSSMAIGRFVGDKLISNLGRQKVLQMSGIIIASGLLVSVLLPYLVTATIGFLGFLMGPPLIGYIAQAASLRLSFTVIACFGASIFFTAPRLKEA